MLLGERVPPVIFLVVPGGNGIILITSPKVAGVCPFHKVGDSQLGIVVLLIALKIVIAKSAQFFVLILYKVLDWNAALMLFIVLSNSSKYKKIELFKYYYISCMYSNEDDWQSFTKKISVYSRSR